MWILRRGLGHGSHSGIWGRTFATGVHLYYWYDEDRHTNWYIHLQRIPMPSTHSDPLGPPLWPPNTQPIWFCAKFFNKSRVTTQHQKLWPVRRGASAGIVNDADQPAVAPWQGCATIVTCSLPSTQVHFPNSRPRMKFGKVVRKRLKGKAVIRLIRWLWWLL